MLAAAFPDVGIGLHGVSLAFGLTVLSGAYALEPISGGHFNPAVSVGLWAGGRFPAALLGPYVVTQVAGAVIGAGVLYVIASGRADFSLAGGFQASLDHKQRLQQLFFPESARRNSIQSNRRTAPLFNYLAPDQSAEEILVSPEGIVPARNEHLRVAARLMTDGRNQFERSANW